jgi:hypothetical protein
MNAALKRLEVPVSVEERVARVEADIRNVLSTLTEIKIDIKSVEDDVRKLRKELHTFEIEVIKMHGAAVK